MTARALMVGGRTGVILDAGNGATVQQVDAVAPYDTTVGIRFNIDGTVETGKAINGAGISWTSAGEWIDPNSHADSIYSVRYTNRVGDDFTTKAAAEDSFIGLGSQRTWIMNSIVLEEIDFTCDFEVRETAGAPPATASAAYTFDIDNTA